MPAQGLDFLAGEEALSDTARVAVGLRDVGLHAKLAGADGEREAVGEQGQLDTDARVRRPFTLPGKDVLVKAIARQGKHGRVFTEPTFQVREWIGQRRA